MPSFDLSKKLPLNFYHQDLLTAAQKLLGKILVRKIDNSFYLYSKIVETEAYSKNGDEASHSFKGKTKSNSVMFEGGGKLYVYFTYGMYFCSNIVIGNTEQGEAVLIRAIEPLNGFDILSMNRFQKSKISEKEKFNLTSGPGKLSIALNITKNENGIDLLGNEIFILDNDDIPNNELAISKRIGISKSKDLLWRFYIKNNSYVSRK